MKNEIRFGDVLIIIIHSKNVSYLYENKLFHLSFACNFNGDWLCM